MRCKQCNTRLIKNQKKFCNSTCANLFRYGKKNIDWNKIQKVYDSGSTYAEVQKQFNIASSTLARAKKIGIFKTRSMSEALKLSVKNGRKGLPLSDETKAKISISRKRFLEENPDMVPYKLNHYTSGRSYAEKYWKKILENNDIDFEEQKQIKLYCLDFAINGNIDLEIDGDQHHLDPRIVESDKKRTEYLENNGWKVIRIKWSDYQKLDKTNKRVFVNKIINEFRINS